MAKVKENVKVDGVDNTIEVDGVEVECSDLVSININGVEYTASKGIVIVPADCVELVKSHG